MKTEPAAYDEPLIRQLSVWGIWLLAINGMIGAGIFGVPAAAARLTGIYSPFVYLGCGLLIAAVLLCFAEVASYFRNTGGPILYARTAFGALAGFEAGWALYTARVTAFAANINLVLDSLGYFWEQASIGAPRIFLLFLICALLAWVNVIGAKQAMRAVGLLTVLKFLPLLLLVLFGLDYLEPPSFPFARAPAPDLTSIGTAALLLIYAFVGWESALIPAGETRNPAREMPLALFWALGIVTLLYMLVQAVSVAVLPELAESERPLVDVGVTLLGPAGAILLTAGVIVSVGGNSASSMFTAPRMTYALAREGSLPAWFGAVHPTYRTPANSIIFYAVLVFALAAYGTFLWLAAISALTRVLIYMVCIGAIPRLRGRFGRIPDRFRLPWGYTIPIAAFVVCAWLLSSVQLHAVLVTALFLVVGGLLYFLVRWRA